jgi:phage antirepressor YoqD-like protein
MGAIDFNGNQIRFIFSESEPYFALTDIRKALNVTRSAFYSLEQTWLEGRDKKYSKLGGKQSLLVVSLMAIRDIVGKMKLYPTEKAIRAVDILEKCKNVHSKYPVLRTTVDETFPPEKKVVEVKSVNDIEIKEYKGQRVVTFKDIDEVHGRPEGTAKRNFTQNKKHLIEGEDFFNLTPSQKDEFRTIEIPNRGITIFTESGYLMLVKSFTDDLAWEVQRNIVKSYFKVPKNNQLSLPQSYEEALEQLLLSVKTQKALEVKALMLEQQVKEAEPKLTYVDTILESKNAVLISQIAKDYGLSGQALNKILHEEGIQYKLGSQWLLYSNHQDKGYTKSKTYIDPTGESRIHTLWTQKGRLFIHEILKVRGIEPLVDREKPDAPTSDRQEKYSNHIIPQ